MSNVCLGGKVARALALAGALALAVALWVAPGQALAEGVPEPAIGTGANASMLDDYGLVALQAEGRYPDDGWRSCRGYRAEYGSL